MDVKERRLVSCDSHLRNVPCKRGEPPLAVVMRVGVSPLSTPDHIQTRKRKTKTIAALGIILDSLMEGYSTKTKSAVPDSRNVWHAGEEKKQRGWIF